LNQTLQAGGQGGTPLARCISPLVTNGYRNAILPHPRFMMFNVFMKKLREIAKHSRTRFDRVLAKKSVTRSVTGRKRVNCSFNEQDFNKLIAFSKKSGRKPTAVLRETFFAYLGKEFILPEDLEKNLQKFIFQLRSIGNNLNQIARKTNKLKKAANFFDLKKELARLHDLEESIYKYIQK